MVFVHPPEWTATMATFATTAVSMPVPARDLRNHYGSLLDRAADGESIDIERDGRLVATLGPPRRPLGTPRQRLVEVFEHAERLDPEIFFDDLYGPTGLDDSFGAEAGREA